MGVRKRELERDSEREREKERERERERKRGRGRQRVMEGIRRGSEKEIVRACACARRLNYKASARTCLEIEDCTF